MSKLIPCAWGLVFDFPIYKKKRGNLSFARPTLDSSGIA